MTKAPVRPAEVCRHGWFHRSRGARRAWARDRTVAIRFMATEAPGIWAGLNVEEIAALARHGGVWVDDLIQ